MIPPPIQVPPIPGLSLLYEKTLTAPGALHTIPSSFVNGNRDGMYLVVAEVRSSAASANDIFYLPNGSNVNTSAQIGDDVNVARTVSRYNSVGVARQGVTLLVGIIMAKANGLFPRVSLWWSGTSDNGPQATDSFLATQLWNDISTNLTSIVLDAGGVAAAFGIGSRIRLWRMG